MKINKNNLNGGLGAMFRNVVMCDDSGAFNYRLTRVFPPFTWHGFINFDQFGARSDTKFHFDAREIAPTFHSFWEIVPISHAQSYTTLCQETSHLIKSDITHEILPRRASRKKSWE